MRKFILIASFLLITNASLAIRYDLRSDSTIIDVSSPSFKNLIQLSSAPTPSIPSAGHGKLYIKSDGLPYYVNSAGSEYAMTGSSTVYPSARSLIANLQSAGQLNLTDSNWNANRVVITQIKISVVSGSTADYDVKIYSRDTFLDSSMVYPIYDNSSAHDLSVLPNLTYENLNGTKELLIEIIDNDGTGNPRFNIEVTGWGLN